MRYNTGTVHFMHCCPQGHSPRGRICGAPCKHGAGRVVIAAQCALEQFIGKGFRNDDVALQKSVLSLGHPLRDGIAKPVIFCWGAGWLCGCAGRLGWGHGCSVAGKAINTGTGKLWEGTQLHSICMGLYRVPSWLTALLTTTSQVSMGYRDIVVSVSRLPMACCKDVGTVPQSQTLRTGYNQGVLLDT